LSSFNLFKGKKLGLTTGFLPLLNKKD